MVQMCIRDSLGPCAANGANEEAVKLFLEDKIGFLDIGRLVEAVVDSDRFGGDYTLSDVYAVSYTHLDVYKRQPCGDPRGEKAHRLPRGRPCRGRLLLQASPPRA